MLINQVTFLVTTMELWVCQLPSWTNTIQTNLRLFGKRVEIQELVPPMKYYQNCHINHIKKIEVVAPFLKDSVVIPAF